MSSCFLPVSSLFLFSFPFNWLSVLLSLYFFNLFNLFLRNSLSLLMLLLVLLLWLFLSSFLLVRPVTRPVLNSRAGCGLFLAEAMTMPVHCQGRQGILGIHAVRRDTRALGMQDVDRQRHCHRRHGDTSGLSTASTHGCSSCAASCEASAQGCVSCAARSCAARRSSMSR